MVVTGWSNGDWSRSGPGYGIKLRLDDRDRKFDCSWPEVATQLEGNGAIAVHLLALRFAVLEKVNP